MLIDPTFFEEVDPFTKAAELHDASYCNKITNADERDYCIATVTSDFEKCLSLNENQDWLVTDSIKDECIDAIAGSLGKSPSKLTWCDKTIDNATRLRCRAKLLDDTSVCDENEYIEDKIFCIIELATSSGDIKICENYDFSKSGEFASEDKDDCYLNIFYKTKNNSVCNKIIDVDTRDLCK